MMAAMIAEGDADPLRDAVRPCRTTEHVEDLAARQKHLAIGAADDIRPENAAALVAIGADLLAVLNSVYNSADPERASRTFSQLFENARP